MKKLFLSLALPILFTPAAFAGTNPSQVVELFTSQGCSSCPPSNALVNDWAGRDDVLALTYSVEYWDYLGWKDTFADPKFTARQKAYAEAIGHGRVYTPQMIINGQIDKFRYSRAEIKDVTLSADTLDITFDGNDLFIPANPDVDSPASVRLVTYIPGSQTVQVQRGENGGRTLMLTNVVTDVTDLGVWANKDSRFSLPETKPGETYAALVQDGEYGPIIAATLREE